MPGEHILTGDAPDEVPSNGQERGGLDAHPSIHMASALARLSALAAEDTDRHQLLGEIPGLVRDAVPAVAWASISLGSPLEPDRLASDSREAQDFDGLQLQAQEGPCYQAYASRATVLAPDVSADSRWPTLAALAQHSPVSSVLAVPVREAPEATGVLNLYSPDRDAFAAVSQRIAELVGTAVSGLLQSVGQRRTLERLADDLRTALISRAVINQAKGILMARLDITADEAFARLVALSNQRNVKVRDLATLVTEGGFDDLMRRDDAGHGD